MRVAGLFALSANFLATTETGEYNLSAEFRRRRGSAAVGGRAGVAG
ncbi:hypothetical protein BCF44_101825 [Kutzneria buriramensis]|uniref:Uncharacterized protein n=1 Tax=Kutzneria buriramensis TaxID=1045776 RepID=A0A3E0IAY3_9PSEU|nr:hypothetical protein BCF44_101825 [Kutzneria buriramensis]